MGLVVTAPHWYRPRVLHRNAALLALLLIPFSAAAYRPARTSKSKKDLQWVGTNCVRFFVDPRGSDDISDGSDISAIEAAMQTWREATASCSYMRLAIAGKSEDLPTGFEPNAPLENTITWVEDGWTASAGTSVLPTLYFVDQPEKPNDGQILKVDIELNGEHFSWATTGEVGAMDVQSAVTYALGAALGLASVCWEYAGDPPLDHTGVPIPRCDDAPNALLSQVMYPWADPGSTAKREPNSDDILGLCETYPVADDPGDCIVSTPPTGDAGPGDAGSISDATASSSGCSYGVNGADCGGPGSLAGLVFFLVVFLTRSRRSGSAGISA